MEPSDAAAVALARRALASYDGAEKTAQELVAKIGLIGFPSVEKAVDFHARMLRVSLFGKNHTQEADRLRTALASLEAS